MVRRSPVFEQAFTGFVLADAATGKVWCAENADTYFTPASNTKTLTLAAALHTLGDSLPAFRYAARRDTLYVLPFGDPTFLHPDFAAWQSGFRFLQQHPARYIAMGDPAPRLLPYGPGWMWDDFTSEYSPERSIFPVFGNLRSLSRVTGDSLRVEPPYWNAFLKKADTDSAQVVPQWGSNQIVYDRRARFSKNYVSWYPVQDTRTHNPRLLADTLKKAVMFSDRLPVLPGWKTWYSVPADTVYRRLMHQSDNLFAEQLLLMSAATATGRMESAAMIEKMKGTLFTDLPSDLKSAQSPQWVDGSGLSRYNMFTPRTNAAALYHLWHTQKRVRLLSIFPAGGVSGTISGWYGIGSTPQTPYTFAKTGSMTGVHCLSGYLVTQKGRVLIFSFMHNNFKGSSKPYKEEMQRLLYHIYRRF